MNIYPYDGALDQAKAYMSIAGYESATKRDLKSYVRIMKGYLDVDKYANRIVDTYMRVHGQAGNTGRESSAPENKLRTRDRAILEVAERKILPARLIHEFRFGPQAGFSIDSISDLNTRLFSDLYLRAGEFKSDRACEDLRVMLADWADKFKSQVSHEMIDGLMDALYQADAFAVGNLFTAMAYTAKIAWFWGYTVRFTSLEFDNKFDMSVTDRHGDCRHKILQV